LLVEYLDETVGGFEVSALEGNGAQRIKAKGKIIAMTFEAPLRQD